MFIEVLFVIEKKKKTENQNVCKLMNWESRGSIFIQWNINSQKRTEKLMHVTR